MSCALLSACGEKTDVSGSKYIGTWKADKMSMLGEEEPLEHELYVTLNGDGTAEFFDGESTSSCEWVETDNGFKLKGGVKLTFKAVGEDVKTTIVGADIVFTRQ